MQESYLKKIYIVSIVVLLLFLSIDFVKHAKRSFFQLNYDWTTVTEIYHYTDISIDSLSRNYIRIKNHSILPNMPNINNTFCLEIENRSYYYRAANLYKEKDYFLLTGGFWLNKVPSYNFDNLVLTEVALELIQEGTRKICMIGDSQMKWNNAKFMRKELQQENPDLVFVGNSRDLYGYPIHAIDTNKFKNILENFNSIPIADIYILFLGAHDINTNIQDIERQSNDIITGLVDKSARSEILLVTLPKSSIKERSIYNDKINYILNSFTRYNNVQIVDLARELQQEPTINYLLDDKIHMNKKGYEILHELLTEKLK